MTPRPTTKAVILARGLGTRMRRADATPLTPQQALAADTGSKALLPVGSGGRPFLDYVLSALADAGIREVCLVVAPDDSALQNRYGDELPLERLRVSFAFQEKALGSADALLAAGQFAGQDNTLVLNSDNYYPVEVVHALAAAGAPATAGFDRNALVRLGHIDAERVRAYALLQTNDTDVLADIIEKPDADTFARMMSAPVSMNIWSMPPEIFDACRRVQPSERGELELPSAVRLAIHDGVGFRVLPFALGVLDLSHRADVPAVAARLSGLKVQL